MRGLVVTLTLLSLVACSKKGDGAPSCAQVADRMIALTKTEAHKDNLVAECEARKVSPAQRTCMVNAKDMGELAGCVGKRRMTRSEENPPPVKEKSPFGPNDPHNLPLRPSAPMAGSGSAAP